MEKYEAVKDLGAGNFGVARLMRNKETKELVAMKYIERGQKVSFFLSFQKKYNSILYFVFSFLQSSDLLLLSRFACEMMINEELVRLELWFVKSEKSRKGVTCFFGSQFHHAWLKEMLEGMENTIIKYFVFKWGVAVSWR